MRTTFILQTIRGELPPSAKALKRALGERCARCLTIEHQPFSSELEKVPEISSTAGLVAYGLDSFLYACSQHKSLAKGLHLLRNKACYWAVANRLGPLAWNQSGRVITLGEDSLPSVEKILLSKAVRGRVFVRSVFDDKIISGAVLSVDEVFDWVERNEDRASSIWSPTSDFMRGGRERKPPQIYVDRPTEPPAEEYRFVFFEQKCLGGWRYLPNFIRWGSVYEQAMAFAGVVARLLDITGVLYCIDVAIGPDEDKTPYFLEINSFSNSGLPTSKSGSSAEHSARCLLEDLVSNIDKALCASVERIQGS